MDFKKSKLYQDYNIDIFSPNINKIILNYLFYIPKTNKELKKTVKEWLFNKKNTLKKYGNISNWCTFYITDMSDLFSIELSHDRLLLHEFNDDITRWDTQNVLDMSYMFSGCIKFNQNLSKWTIRKETDKTHMFNLTSK